MSPAPRPFSLLAELTHRCPLHCPYCSNPLKLDGCADELSTQEWKHVLEQAAALGVLHVGFSGGEPLVRHDLVALINTARTLGLYSNLITSAIGLTRLHADQLKVSGLDSVQISLQSDEPSLADKIAGATAHGLKLQACRMVREIGLPLTINVVLHRANIDRTAQIIALAESLEADRLELANAQYYGWAFANRAALLPTRAQIDAAIEVTQSAKKRLAGKMEILFVIPDYFSDRPKACMHGWGQKHITVNPVGEVLPCPTAAEIAGMRFENVRSRPLDWIWKSSESFARFRGTGWMPEPCQSCEFKELDFGGCRCQAALITGDPGNTDPACGLSPHHEKLVQVTSRAAQTGAQQEWVYRQNVLA